MDALLDQLGLDNSFFIELAILAILFPFLSHFYFRPFLRLFQARYRRTIEDKQAAERLMAQAQAQMEEYKQRLAHERLSMKEEFELALTEAKKQEAEWLAKTREEGKKVTQNAIESINQQKDEIRTQLNSDVDALARAIAEKLLARKI